MLNDKENGKLLIKVKLSKFSKADDFLISSFVALHPDNSRMKNKKLCHFHYDLIYLHDFCILFLTSFLHQVR